MKPTSGSKRRSKRKRGKPFRLIAVGGDKYKSFDEAWQGAKQDLAALFLERLVREEQEKQEGECEDKRHYRHTL